MTTADSDGHRPNVGEGGFASSPGKVILFGEHAVVHGYPAIAAPLQRRVTAHVVPDGSGTVSIDAEGDVGPILPVAVTACLKSFGIHGAKVAFGGDLPRSVGLGSSAALSVALVKACAAASGCLLSDGQTLERAMDVERSFHGNPSGLDHTVSYTGKILRFVRGVPFSEVRLARPMDAVVWVVSPRGSAKERIARISEMAKDDPERVRGIFSAIRDLSEEAVSAMERGDLELVGRNMDVNHRCLSELDLSTPSLDEACRRLRDAGAYGAKLTGAGGGGAVVALCQDAQGILRTLDLPENVAFPVRWNPA